MTTALARIGISESQATAEHGHNRVSTTPMYRELREALTWFRAEWQDALPRRLHETDPAAIEAGDSLGGAAWTERWRNYLMGEPRDPLRRALAVMLRGPLFDRIGAQFLFRLACLDF